MSKKKKKKEKELRKEKKRRSSGAGEQPAAAEKRGAAAKGPATESCPGGKKCEVPRKHLCRIAKKGDIDALRELVRGAAYVCAKCGRAAASRKSLCRPVEL